MKRRSLVIAVVLLATAIAGISPASAGAHGDGGTYLALGDSVAAGTQAPLPFTDNSYTNRLFQILQSDRGFDEFVNLACPGDDTVEMRFGIGGATPTGSLCYGPFAVLPPGGTSQLDAAVAYLLAHPGEVELITITMGANDILACDPSDPPPVFQACLAAQLGQIGANLPVIVGTLQAAAPGVPIVAMNYYSPNLAYWLDDPATLAPNLAFTAAFNGALHAVYGAFGIPVADVATAFKTFNTNGAQVPANVRTVCKYTRMCEKQGPDYVFFDARPDIDGVQPDIHPSNEGYRKIATTFAELIAGAGLLS